MLHNHTLPCKHPNKEWYKNVNSTCCGSRFLRSLFCWGDVLYWFLFWSFMSWRLLKNINTRSDFTLSFSFNRISTRNTVCLLFLWIFFACHCTLTVAAGESRRADELFEPQHSRASGLSSGLKSLSSGKSDSFTSNVLLFATSWDVSLSSDFRAGLVPL